MIHCYRVRCGNPEAKTEATHVRSMIQAFEKESKEAVELYRKAFNAEILCTYDDGKGGYMHSELNAYGQVINVSEISEGVTIGNLMMFCFHFGEGSENRWISTAIARQGLSALTNSM